MLQNGKPMALCTPRKCIQAVLIIAFISFVVVNIHFLSPVSDSLAPHIGIDKISARKPRTSKLNSDSKNATKDVDLAVTHKQIAPAPVHAGVNVGNVRQLINNSEVKVIERVNGEPVVANSKDSSAERYSQFNESLSFIINDINKKEKIRNMETFPPITETNSYDHVLAIQVHNRDHYLKYLVDSLRNTQHINSSLLIVSHDFYSQAVFDIISSIKFMPVIQIFYPLAMQLYKNKYPGPDPADCPRDLKKERAKNKGCINADYPDKYGHYREAAYAQTKLHWYWKLSYIFDNLSIMKNFTGYVTLIEEDHYVTPDTLQVLHEMIAAKSRLCAHCRILTLGNYDKKPTYAFSDEVVVAPDFISSRHNMAMSINRDTYQLIKKYSHEFCNYDDYNWDWSLQYIGREVIPGKLPTMIVKTPRVYHIGDCGVHHKGKKCNPEEKVKPITDLVKGNQAKLFPHSLKLGKPTSNTYIAYKKLKANGGWGDKRDHDLCASFML